MEEIFKPEEINKNVFGTGTLPPGSMSQLGLKILLQTLGNCILVNASGDVTLLAKTDAVRVPFVHLGTDAATAAAAIAHCYKGGHVPVVAYAGDGATRRHITSLQAACKTRESFVYVCYNNSGSDITGHHHGDEESIAPLIADYATYTATASLAYPEDMIAKIRKAKTVIGVSFIELFAPSAALLNIDPSNMIEISRIAVQTGVWPVYEVENGKVHITKRPNRLESLQQYSEIIHRKVADGAQDRINKKWKQLTEGRLV